MLGPVVDKLKSTIDEFQSVVAEVETADLSWPETRDHLLELEELRERFDHSIGALVSDMDAHGAAARDGSRSMAAWLAKHTGQRRSITGSRAWLATRLRSMPRTNAAVADASITASHAQVLTRAQNPRTLDAFARDEGMLVEAARKLTADQLVQVVEHWLRFNDLDGPEPDDVRDNVFHLSTTLDGRLKGDFDLGGDLAIRTKAIVDEAVNQVMRRDKAARKTDPTDPRAAETMSRRRARAFAELLDRASVSPNNPARRQPLFSIVTTLDTLTGTGDPLDWRTDIDLGWRSAIPLSLRDRWTCDAHVSRVILNAKGEPLDVGRSERVATPAQRRALLAQYGGCAVPGCDAPACQVEAHHIEWWIEGGPTDLGNLLPACNWDHHRIHSGDLKVERVDGHLQFRLRDGRLLTDPRASPNSDAA